MPHDPGSPASWLHFAESDFMIAHSGYQPGMLFEILASTHTA